jgi:capsule polysaccharide export protein KpsE/RkpR
MSDNTNRNQSANTISLLDLVAVCVRNKWLILITTGFAAILIVLYSLYSLRAAPEAPLNLLPNYFEPATKVRILDQEQSSISSILRESNELGLLATIAGAAADGASNAELAQTLLVGNRILDELAGEFDILKRFDIVEDPKSTSRALLSDAFETDFNPETGILTISFRSVDRYFATEILASAVDKLESFFDELTLQKVLEKKRLLAESIATYESDLKAAQQALIDFQSRNNIIDISLQTEYQLNSLANLEGQILVKETELNALTETRRADDPEVLRAKMDLNLLKTRRDMITLGQRGSDNSLEIPLAQLPELSAVYANLMTDLEILQVIYSSLRSQYEALKIEEKDNSERFQVIEQAEVPERKAGPSRGMICIIVTLSAFLISVLYAFFLDYLRGIRLEPVESEKLKDIQSMLHKQQRKK